MRSTCLRILNRAIQNSRGQALFFAKLLGMRMLGLEGKTETVTTKEFSLGKCRGL